jgi:hypothetical protein
MDEERIKGLIGEVARQGERLGTGISGGELRTRSGADPANADGRGVRRPSKRWQRFGRVAAVAALILVATPIVAAIVFVALPLSTHTAGRAAVSSTTAKPGPASTTTPAPGGSSPAQVAVGRAVGNTDAAGNFDISFILDGGSGMGSNSVTGAGDAYLTPSIAMNLNDVIGASLWFSPDNAWEQLGPSGSSYSEYTLPAFSVFAEGVVGTDAGALGTLGFCSPTGLFDLSQSSIGPTTEVGTATVDGITTTEYSVTVDPTTFLAAPGITAGEDQAMKTAITVLGRGRITDDVYIDASGDVVRTVASIDGASLQVDLSNFGAAPPVTLPPQQSAIDSATTPPATQVTKTCNPPTTVTPESSNGGVTNELCISASGGATYSPVTTLGSTGSSTTTSGPPTRSTTTTTTAGGG